MAPRGAGCAAEGRDGALPLHIALGTISVGRFECEKK